VPPVRASARLEEAVAAFRAALKEQMHDRVPLEWARTQLNVGLALAALGDRAHSIDRLHEALTCLQQAAPALQAIGLTEEAKIADDSAGRLRGELAKKYRYDRSTHKALRLGE
jgi:hypothetical protein